MGRRIIVVEDVDEDGSRLEQALEVLQDQGLKAYLASSMFLPPQSEPIPPEAGEITATQTLLNQKTLLEEELRKYRILLANSGDLMYAFDFGGTITYVTPNVKDYLDYEPEEVVGQSFLNFIPLEQHVQAVEQFKRVSGVGYYTLPANLVKRDGQYIPVEITSRTLFEDGLPTMHIGIARDVTERRNLERAMRKRNRELSALFSVASVLNQSLELDALLQTCLERMMEALEVDSGGIFLLGPDNEFRQWAAKGLDERFERLFAPFRENQNLINRVMQDAEVVLIDDLTTRPQLDQELLAQLNFRAVAIGPLHSKSRVLGAFVLARKAANSFSEDDRELILSVGRQVGMAIETAALYTELNNTVSEVRKANARLEEATRHKSEFLANMSHELRTPLNAIIGFSEILQDQSFGELNPKQARYVGNILSSGKNLLALVNDVLDLSKVEAGKMELDTEEFNLADVVNDVLNIVGVMSQKKQIGLGVRPGDIVRNVIADRGKIKQILYNLLSNAVKFTPEGGTVEVQIRRAEDFVEIDVIDSGIGISEADYERIFDEFQMLDNVLTKKQQGTGLGLALSRRLAQLHGGVIRVQSEVGQGSIFTLSLPLASSPFLAETPLLSQTQEVSQNNQKWALIVEDDDKSAELLQFYLEQNGYRVARAERGETALAQAKALKPAVISLDIILPSKNGWEVLRELKNDPETRDIPVLVISMVDNRNISFELGAVACFVKPVRREALAESLNRLKLDELRQNRRRQLETHLQQGEPLQALVIDDNPHDRELISTTLSLVGFKVATASDGAAGWQMALHHPPDLMVLDLMMPELDGFEVLSRLRQNPATTDVPVFIYTAKELDARERSQLGSTAEAVLQKGDFSRQNLLKAVGRLTSENE